MLALQQAMDEYLQQRANTSAAQTAELFEQLARYLVHCSDLFQDMDEDEQGEMSEWEDALEAQMMQLLDGDVEPAHDLGAAPLSRLHSGHVREFVGWFLLRESANSEMIRVAGEVLAGWFTFLRDRGYWPGRQFLEFDAMLKEVVPEAMRAAVLARALYDYARSGCAMAPEARGKPFDRFVEGHARAYALVADGVLFRFDSQQQDYGPVRLPDAILQLVREGDVFDVELGLRAGCWYIVDVGPVYPGCVYVEAEEVAGLDKIS